MQIATVNSIQINVRQYTCANVTAHENNLEFPACREIKHTYRQWKTSQEAMYALEWNVHVQTVDTSEYLKLQKFQGGAYPQTPLQ